MIEIYYKDCAKLVQQLTDCKEVYVFDHNVRCATANKEGKKLDGGNNVQPPIPKVHTDYTITSAVDRIKLLANAPKLNDTMYPYLDGKALIPQEIVDKGGRFLIINVWRNISTEPVQRTPLACCSSDSFRKDDLAVLEVPPCPLNTNVT